MSFEAHTTVPGLDIIVVAAGPTADDGTPLSLLTVDGEQLLQVTLQEIAMTRGLQQVVVVSDREISTLPGVKVAVEPTAAEDPVAAIATGVRALWHEASEETAILAAWAPETPQLLADLWEAIGDADASIALDDDEQPETVWGSVWRTTALWKVFEFLPEGNCDHSFILGGHTIAAVDTNGLTRAYTTEVELAEFGEVGRA